MKERIVDAVLVPRDKVNDDAHMRAALHDGPALEPRLPVYFARPKRRGRYDRDALCGMGTFVERWNIVSCTQCGAFTRCQPVLAAARIVFHCDECLDVELDDEMLELIYVKAGVSGPNRYVHRNTSISYGFCYVCGKFAQTGGHPYGRNGQRSGGVLYCALHIPLVLKENDFELIYVKAGVSMSTTKNYG